MRRPRLALTIAASLVLLTACASSGPGPGPTAATMCPYRGPTSEGEPLPDCSFAGINGSKDLRLTDLAGTPAVLNFWASWCNACIAEMPSFERVHIDLGDRVTFVGFDQLGVQGETTAQAIRFAGKTGVTYRLVSDPNGELFGHFLARTVLPITVFVDAQGRVAGRHFGGLTEQDLRSEIQDVLHIPA